MIFSAHHLDNLQSEFVDAFVLRQRQSHLWGGGGAGGVKIDGGMEGGGGVKVAAVGKTCGVVYLTAGSIFEA